MSDAKRAREKAYPSELSFGMDLRDYFAGQVIQSFIITGAIGEAESPADRTVCKLAYHVADLMVAVRDE